MTIPADIEHPDKLLAGLTARQLAILTPAIVVVWLVFMATRSIVPLPVFAVIAVVVLGAVAALALVERDGISLDRLVVYALAQQREARYLVLAPEGVPDLPAWAQAATAARGTRGHTATTQAPAMVPLRLPAHAIRPEGVIDLGAGGLAAVVACSTVSFALRTADEQAGLVDAFGGWLNSLTNPVQILVHAAPVNLAPAIGVLREQAGGLPHPALEEAACDHADFLAELASRRELLARQVLIVLREPYGPATEATGAGGGRGRDVGGAATRVLRRAEQTGRALAAAGITATVLDAHQVAAALAQAADPSAPPMGAGMAAPHEPITASTRPSTGGRR